MSDSALMDSARGVPWTLSAIKSKPTRPREMRKQHTPDAVYSPNWTGPQKLVVPSNGNYHVRLIIESACQFSQDVSGVHTWPTKVVDPDIPAGIETRQPILDLSDESNVLKGPAIHG